MNDTGEVFYTYSTCEREEGERRWRDDDTGYDVFETFDEAKADLLALRKDIGNDPDVAWRPMQIEKIVMRPMSRTNLLVLLNDGMEAGVAEFEVIEIVP